MPETPWFSEPPLAYLVWPESEGDLGHLTFIDPNGERAHILVTHGPTTQLKATNSAGEEVPGSNVWHVEEQGDLLVVSPSIHFIDHFHSPNPVQFRRSAGPVW